MTVQQNLIRTLSLCGLVIAVPMLAEEAAQAGMIPTADSPAFEKPFSVDAGISVEMREVETKVPASNTEKKTKKEEAVAQTPDENILTYYDLETHQEVKIYDTQIDHDRPLYSNDDHGSSGDDDNNSSDPDCDEFGNPVNASRRESQSEVRNHQRLNAKVGKDSLVYVARNNSEISLGGAQRFGALAVSAGYNVSSGTVDGSVAYAVVKNTSVYAELDRQHMNYGIQQQIGDYAIQGYYSPDRQAYGFGVAVNFGSSAPAPAKVAEKPVAPPVAVPPVKVVPPVTEPECEPCDNDYTTPGLPVVPEVAPPKTRRPRG